MHPEGRCTKNVFYDIMQMNLFFDAFSGMFLYKQSASTFDSSSTRV
jgi:hypothetical protein